MGMCTRVRLANVSLTVFSYRLMEEDIINIDVTLYLNGYHGDTSQTFDVGNAVRALALPQILF